MSAFILDSDTSVLITDEQLNQVTTNQSDIDICLNQSEEEVKEYLRHRFDVEFDMREIAEVQDSNSVTATKDDRLYYKTDEKHYLCIKDATNQSLTNTEYFTQTDDRNQKLVQITIDVFLYHLHARLNPRNIPLHRRIRYDGDGEIQKAMSAIKWLLMVQKGTITPNLTPLLDEDGDQVQTGQSIIYGNSKYPTSTSENDLTGN